MFGSPLAYRIKLQWTKNVNEIIQNIIKKTMLFNDERSNKMAVNFEDDEGMKVGMTKACSRLPCP